MEKYSRSSNGTGKCQFEALIMKNPIPILFMIFSSVVYSQDVDSLMQSLSNDSQQYPVQSTFKSPKLVLLQTNETQKQKNLTFWIAHRFGDIGGDSGGARSLFGLDAATDIHFGFDYGITDDLTVGIGRSRFNETYNALGKLRLMKQLEGVMPLSVTAFGQSSWITRREFFDNEFENEGERISHFFQVILAKKFSSSFSAMVNPGYLLGHHVQEPGDKENFFVLGIGGRLKLTKRLSLIADYMSVNDLDRPGDLAGGYTNPLGVGLEIETGGHVFSLNFQNAPFITENNFIPNTSKSWNDGEVRFGFSISRNFYLGSKQERQTESNYE